MSLSRSILRIRPAVTAPLLRPVRLASTGPGHLKGNDDLGGPGGQQPSPPNPGGPEAIQRNWVPIAAGLALLGGGAYYFSSGKPPAQVQAETELKSLLSQVNDPAERARLMEKYKGKEIQALKEFSGRKDGGDLKGFRAE